MSKQSKYAIQNLGYDDTNKQIQHTMQNLKYNRSGGMLRVSEVFHSIQGEGVSLGKPAVFVRLAGCNLNCKFCDTKYANTEQPSETPYRWIIDSIKKFKCKRIIWTGGEPLLQKEMICKVIAEMNQDYNHELETNGTLMPDILFFDIITVSPKRGDVVFDVLKDLAFHHRKVYFKFVCESEDDFYFWYNLANKIKVENKNMMFMPEGITTETLNKNSEWLIELCKKHNVRYTPRLQIYLWGCKRGI